MAGGIGKNISTHHHIRGVALEISIVAKNIIHSSRDLLVPPVMVKDVFLKEQPVDTRSVQSLRMCIASGIRIGDHVPSQRDVSDRAHVCLEDYIGAVVTN